MKLYKRGRKICRKGRNVMRRRHSGEELMQQRKMYGLTEEELHAPITKEIGRQCRHRLERRWYRRLIEINILLIVVVISVFVMNLPDYKNFVKEASEQIQEEMETVNTDSGDGKKDTGKDTGKDGDKEKKTFSAEDIPFGMQMMGYGLIILVVGYLALYFMYAQYRSMSLRITERNFPEVYRTIEEYADRLGIAVPKAYIMQSNGVLNAFSAFLFRRQWIVIHSELFEVAYREHKDMNALNFVIAHEMAHIYYGHATLHYNLPIWFSRLVPLVGSIASRTREYSCDRLAQRLTGTDGLDAMLALVVDRHLYKMVDKEDYIEEMRNQKGFFIWVVNLLADHPVMCRRVPALVDGRGSGKLY